MAQAVTEEGLRSGYINIIGVDQSPQKTHVLSIGREMRFAEVQAMDSYNK